MPKLSQRSIEAPASAIRKLVPYAEAAKKKGIEVYHLNIGQPDIKTPENALQAIKKIDENVIAYSHSAGLEEYRRGLAKYYQKINIDVDYSDILVTTGGSEALFFAMVVAFNPGDELIIPEPFYTNYNAFAKLAGINIVPITSKIEDGFALPKLKDFEDKMTDRTRGILICNPSNPTGGMYQQAELEKLKDFAIKHDLYIIADEVYREFVYDGKEHFSVMHLSGVEDRAILIDSTSKRYSECGARMGCMVSKNKEFVENTLKYAQARLSPPYFGQILGMASLETPKSYFKKVYDEYVERRNFLIEEINKIDGVYSPMPQGAFYTIARLPIDDSDKFCRWMLEEFNYKKQTVMMAPATGFYATHGLGKNEVRIAYVLKKEDLKNAVEVLKYGLEEYKKQI